MKKCILFAAAALMLLGGQAFAREYHVAKNGSDQNEGSAEAPFLTISKAAMVLRSGDTVTVHTGIYRERVSPHNSGLDKYNRIVYRAAPGEEVWIKGSEEVKNWVREGRTNVYKAVVPNVLFGDFNPFAIPVTGDWLNRTPITYHLGDVYLNNLSLYEVGSVEALRNPVVDERSKDPEESLLQWYAEVGDNETTIWANFGGADPNKELVEINVRPAVFFPKLPGINYIAVQGFKLSQAATNWAPPTAFQEGLIGPHWSKGWVIEDNEISNSKCTGISLGKDRASGQNLWTTERTLSGFNRELEAIFKAYDMGWNQDNIGSHLIRNNVIYDCGQTGICGHLGGIFSVIEGNHIYDINAKRQFGGAELGCIKLHAAIDVIIRNNFFDNGYNGVWLDWQAMGTRITGNIFINNDHWDLWTEVTHGPCLVDNNLMLSPNGYFDWSQGTAFVHNIIAGTFVLNPVNERYTPYHSPHSTQIAGIMSFPGGDNRFYNNILAISPKSDHENKTIGLSVYNERPPYYDGIYGMGMGQQQTTNAQMLSFLEQMALGNQQSRGTRLAMRVGSNLYYNGVQPYAYEEHNVTSTFDAHPELEVRGKDVVLKMNLDGSINNLRTVLVTTELLGKTYFSNSYYENPDGTPLTIDTDFAGNRRSLSSPKVGPFENIRTGANEFVVWKLK